MLKRTSLFEEHQRLGGRLIDFGGWELPVQYTGVMDEHLACRSAAGLFDVSHMGEVTVEGRDAEGFLDRLVTNNVAKLAVGQAQYTVMCHPSGGIVDDLVIYRRGPEKFLVVVNASNTEKDFAHIRKIEQEFRAPSSDLRVANASDQYTQIAIQGPKAPAILKKITAADLPAVKTYWFTEGQVCGHIPAILARTGYTGEDGFEIYVAWAQGPEVWRALLAAGDAGALGGIRPVGLGARDTLRLEMKYPLYGNELTDETNPLEAGLSWVVKLDKPAFIGKKALIEAKTQGLSRQLVGIRLTGRGIPRHGYAVYSADGARRIGEITSGTQSPSLQQAIAIAYVAKDHAAPGTGLTVDIRGQKVEAQVVPTPFYNRAKPS